MMTTASTNPSETAGALLPCPLCASEHIVRSTDMRTGEFDVLCTQCGCTSPGSAWNTRPASPPQPCAPYAAAMREALLLVAARMRRNMPNSAYAAEIESLIGGPQC